MKSEMRESAKRAGWWLLLAFVLLSIGSMCSYLYPYQNRVDQNCFFTVGKGMMTGLVPYRDLFEQKGPLLYFLHGLAYLVSPDSFIGVFGLEVASMTLWFVYLYKLARLYTTPRPAMLLVSAAGALLVAAMGEKRPRRSAGGGAGGHDPGGQLPAFLWEKAGGLSPIPVRPDHPPDAGGHPAQLRLSGRRLLSGGGGDAHHQIFL